MIPLANQYGFGRNVMSKFEVTACKVLGIILFLLVIAIGLQLTGCSCPAPQPPSDYMDEVDTSHLV